MKELFFNVTDGPDKGRIVDAFKYYRELSTPDFLCFELSDVHRRPGEDSGMADASVEDFVIEKIENVQHGQMIRLTGECDLFVVDVDKTGQIVYRVDFQMVYDAESHEGQITCSHFRGKDYVSLCN